MHVRCRCASLTKGTAPLAHRFARSVRVLALARLSGLAQRSDFRVVARLNPVRDGESHRAPAVDDVAVNGVDEIKSRGCKVHVVNWCFWLVLDLERVRPNAAGPRRRRSDAVDHVVERDGSED